MINDDLIPSLYQFINLVMLASSVGWPIWFWDVLVVAGTALTCRNGPTIALDRMLPPWALQPLPEHLLRGRRPTGGWQPNPGMERRALPCLDPSRDPSARRPRQRC